MATFVLTGRPKLDAIFEGFEEKLQKKILRPALKDAALGLETVAFRNLSGVVVNLKSRKLRDSLHVQAGTRSRRNKHRVGFQVVTGEGFFKGPTFYGGFVELGHRVGKRPSKVRRAFSGDARLEVAGKHPLKLSYEQGGARAQNAALAAIAEGIEREAAKGGA